MVSEYDLMQDVIVTGKVVLLRVDLNVPIQNGKVQDSTRIMAILPTIRYLCLNGAKIILVSHFGQPKSNERNEKYSLRQLLTLLSDVFGTKIHFVPNIVVRNIQDTIESMDFGEIALLENLRFYDGEKNNDPEFAQILVSFANIYINDAFACSHRKHASIDAVTKFVRSVAGLNFMKEVNRIEQYKNHAKKPLFLILGGAKITTKIPLLESLIPQAQYIFLGGAIANTILKYTGYNIGMSLYEKDYLPTVESLLDTAKQHSCQIMLPTDVVVVKNSNNIMTVTNKGLEQVEDDDIIYDIGTKTIDNIKATIGKVKTVILNGPLGNYEQEPFANGTLEVINAIADAEIDSLAGGGDIINCISQTKRTNDFSFISTGGGAFLEMLSSDSIAGISALKHAKKNWKGSHF